MHNERRNRHRGPASLAKMGSSIMSEASKSQELKYGSEADVQFYVHLVLNDAVAIANHLLGEKERLVARLESSLFTNRPDHSVILDSLSGAQMLTVETKFPFQKAPHEKILGQVFDYISWMRNLGHPNPFALLTTFEETYIAWDAADHVSSEIALDETRLEQDKIASIRKQLRTTTSSITSTPSPAKVESPTTAQTVESDINTYGNRKKRKKVIREVVRELAMSEPFESKGMVTALVNAIFCSLQNFTGAPIVPNLLDKTVLHRPVLTLGKKGYKFEEISNTVKKWEAGAFKNTQEFHIISLLGTGRTSKAYRTISDDGHECVLKMYVRTHDESNNFRVLKKDEFERDAKNSTGRERQRYKQVYGIDVQIVNLHGHLCVVLPYIHLSHAEGRASRLLGGDPSTTSREVPTKKAKDHLLAVP